MDISLPTLISYPKASEDSNLKPFSKEIQIATTCVNLATTCVDHN